MLQFAILVVCDNFVESFALIDSGASVSFVSLSFVDKASLPVREAPKLNVSMATGKSVLTDLMTTVHFSFGTGKRGTVNAEAA